MLSSQDMVYLRSQAEELLPDTCSLFTAQNTSDGQGGFTEAWAATYQDVPCRLSELSGKERLRASMEQVEGDWILTVPYDQVIDAGMRVQHETLTYEVKFVNLGRSYETVKRCALKRIA